MRISARLSAAALTLTRISFGFGVGLATSLISTPRSPSTAAFIVDLPDTVPLLQRDSRFLDQPTHLLTVGLDEIGELAGGARDDLTASCLQRLHDIGRLDRTNKLLVQGRDDVG